MATLAGWILFRSFITRFPETRNYPGIIVAVNRYGSYDDFLDAFIDDEVTDFEERRVTHALHRFLVHHPRAIVTRG
jgi:hypothetical protein